MLDINDFPESLVEYECLRIRDTRTVWINPDGTDDLTKALGHAPSSASFARDFSYVPKSNRCYNAAELDEHDSRIFMAERYGGTGVGNNGGGGRVGNFGAFQAKGVGPNAMAHSVSVWHSYGSLNLLDAAYEAIYSTVLNNVLPLGCATIYGVIHTSASGAYRSQEPGSQKDEFAQASGAIMVRERTLRPAHFLHAANFSPAKSEGLMSETQRMCAVHRRLKTKFDSTNHFIRYLGSFILASCKQFAFARAARIAHGGVTPSNICLDGRWIDMTEARFLSGGKNFRGLTTFFDEPQVIAGVTNQLAYVFGKCNTWHFNTEPLMRYIESTFDGCFAFYTLSIVGFSNANLEQIAESEEGRAFAKTYSSVVLRHRRPVSDLPEHLDPQDPVIAFMRLCYLGLGDAEAAAPSLGQLLRCTATDALATIGAFRSMFRQSMAAEGQDRDPATSRGRAIGSAVRALRWAYLSAYFYRFRISSHLYYVVGEDDLPATGAFIKECIDESKRIFDTACRGKVPIVETPDVDIHFDQSRSVYTVGRSGEHTFARYADCLAFIKANYPHLRMRGSFDPFPYLDGIADVLASLERMQ
jgi:hypothetical protein